MNLDEDQISAFLTEHGRSVGIVLICVPADGVEFTDLDQETRDRLVASTSAQVVKIVSENLGVISAAGMCAARERAHAMWQKLTPPRLVGEDGPLAHEIIDQLRELDQKQLSIVNRSIDIMCRYPKLREMLCDTNRDVIEEELLVLLEGDPTDEEIDRYIRCRTERPL